MTKLKTLLPLMAVLLSATAFASVAQAQDTNANTTTTYHTQTTTETYYHWNPFSSDTQGLTLGAQVGATLPTDDFDDDAVYNLSLGWQFSPMIRTDLEAGYRNVDVDGGPGDADIWTAMLNGYWDFKNDTIVTPYLGAGLGYAHQNLDGVVGGDDNSGAFAYQGIAGLSFAVTDSVALTAQYNYLDTTNFDYSANEIKGGVRVTF